MGARDEAFLKRAEAAGLLRSIDPEGRLGSCWRIYAFVEIDETIPARQFLDSLSDPFKAAYFKMFEKRCQGHILRGEQHHLLRNESGLYKYKHLASQTRLFTATDEGFVEILLFGIYGKKENEGNPRDDALARQKRAEYIARGAALRTVTVLPPRRRS